MLVRSIGICGAALLLASCAGGPPEIAGVWQPDDGSGMKTVNEDGSCSGMYYNRGEPLDIGGGMMCTLGDAKSSDGSYTLVVEQPPNSARYSVTFQGDNTLVIDTGPKKVTLTRQ